MSINTNNVILSMRKGFKSKNSGHSFVEFSEDRKWYRVLVRTPSRHTIYFHYIGWRAVMFGKVGEDPFMFTTPYNNDPQDYLPNDGLDPDSSYEIYKLVNGMKPADDPANNICGRNACAVDNLGKDQRWVNVDKYKDSHDQRLDTLLWQSLCGGFMRKSCGLVKGFDEELQKVRSYKVSCWYYRPRYCSLGTSERYAYHGDDRYGSFSMWTGNRYERPCTKLELLLESGAPAPMEFQFLQHLEYAEKDAKTNTVSGFMKKYPFEDDLPYIKRAYEMRFLTSAPMFLFGHDFRDSSTSDGRVFFKNELGFTTWLFDCPVGNFYTKSIDQIKSADDRTIAEFQAILSSEYGIPDDLRSTAGLLEKLRLAYKKIDRSGFCIKSFSYYNPKKLHRRSRSQISKFGIYDFEILAELDDVPVTFNFGDDASKVSVFAKGRKKTVDFGELSSIIDFVKGEIKEDSFDI